MNEVEYKKNRQFLIDKHESDLKALDRVYAMTREFAESIPVRAPRAPGVLYKAAVELLSQIECIFSVDNFYTSMRALHPDVTKANVHNIIFKMKKKGLIIPADGLSNYKRAS